MISRILFKGELNEVKIEFENEDGSSQMIVGEDFIPKIFEGFIGNTRTTSNLLSGGLIRRYFLSPRTRRLKRNTLRM